MNRIILLLLISLIGLPQSRAQLSLSQAIEKAETHTALAKLPGIAGAQTELKLNTAGKIFLPKISFAGQASYQSDVTELPIDFPGIDIDFLSQDQYRVFGEVNQVLYDGGATSKAKSLIKTAGAVETTETAIELEKVREQIIDLYFSILEIDARIEILQLKEKSLEANLKKIRAGVESGYALKSEADNLEAAQILLEQNLIELSAARGLQVQILSELTGEGYPPDITLQMPQTIAVPKQISNSKSQFQLLELQKTATLQRFELDKSAIVPKANLFFQGGYGKPGLNMLKNEFETFWIGGIRAKWDLGSLYDRSNDRQEQVLNQEKINIKKEAVSQQLEIAAMKQKSEIDKLSLLVGTDAKLLALRENIRRTAEVQLENGVITSSDFLTKLNEENEVRQQQKMREVRLRKAEYLLNLICN